MARREVCADFLGLLVLDDDPSVFAVAENEVDVSRPNAVTLANLPAKLELVYHSPIPIS